MVLGKRIGNFQFPRLETTKKIKHGEGKNGEFQYPIFSHPTLFIHHSFFGPASTFAKHNFYNFLRTKQLEKVNLKLTLKED